MIATGLYRDSLRDATEGAVATFLAILAAPEAPMQAQYAKLCADARGYLAKYGRGWADELDQAPRAPDLWEEGEDLCD